MNVEIDMVAVIQNDDLRNSINAELRERQSCFRIVLLSMDDIRNELNVRTVDDNNYVLTGFDRRHEIDSSIT